MNERTEKMLAWLRGSGMTPTQQAFYLLGWMTGAADPGEGRDILIRAANSLIAREKARESRA